MEKQKTTYEDLLELARSYGVDNNALFVASAKQYSTQQKVIENIRKALDEEDNLMTTKEYVKGRVNVYANPLVRELPKHADSANKTLNTMLDIVLKLGRPVEATSRLDDLMND